MYLDRINILVGTYAALYASTKARPRPALEPQILLETNEPKINTLHRHIGRRIYRRAG